MILVARAWQKGPSQVLPPSCRYQPSCSAYAITAISAMGPRGAAGWRSSASCAATPGAARATTPYPMRIESSERQQEHDPRGGAERARAARLDVGCEPIFPDGQSAEHEDRQRRDSSQCSSRRRSRARPRRRRRCGAFRRARLKPARGIRTPRSGLDQPQGRADRRSSAPHEKQTIARIRRRCGCCRRSGRPAPISRSSAGLPRAHRRPTLDTMWTADGQQLARVIR